MADEEEDLSQVPLSACDPDGIWVRAFLSKGGRFEVNDPVPMEPPIGYKPEPNIGEMIRQMVRRELSQIADSSDLDTFDEAEDFEVEDDPLDPLTPYEKVFEPAPVSTPLPEVGSPVVSPKEQGTGEPAVASPPAGHVEEQPVAKTTTPSASTVPPT